MATFKEGITVSVLENQRLRHKDVIVLTQLDTYQVSDCKPIIPPMMWPGLRGPSTSLLSGPASWSVADPSCSSKDGQDSHSELI